MSGFFILNMKIGRRGQVLLVRSGPERIVVQTEVGTVAGAATAKPMRAARDRMLASMFVSRAACKEVLLRCFKSW